MNLTVVGLSRDAEKRTKLRALGANFVFDPECRNLPRSVSAAISPKKVHLAVDCVGGKLLSHVITMLGYGGRIRIRRPCCSAISAWAVSLLETIPLRPPRPHGRRLSTDWRPLDSVHRLTASSRSKKSRRDSHDWHRVRWGKYWYVWPTKS
jgi:NADPH:quinone reductase-like Zn-dependent oxidoreductase